MKLYLAGPMRGYPGFNFAAFEAAARDLRRQNYSVWSPHESDKEQEWAERQRNHYDPATGHAGEDHRDTLRFFMATDLPAVLSSDAVAVLDGWEASAGCQVETYVAFQCGIPVKAYEPGIPFDMAHEFHRYVHPHFNRES